MFAKATHQYRPHYTDSIGPLLAVSSGARIPASISNVFPIISCLNYVHNSVFWNQCENRVTCHLEPMFPFHVTTSLLYIIWQGNKMLRLHVNGFPKVPVSCSRQPLVNIGNPDLITAFHCRLKPSPLKCSRNTIYEPYNIQKVGI